MNDSELFHALREPFDPKSVEWKPQGQPKQGKVQVVAYVDARAVIKRLNEVLGVKGWSSSFKTLHYDEKQVVVECTLSAEVGGQKAAHADTGSAEMGGFVRTFGDCFKAAYSDAIKRAAVHFGVGSYLYALPSQWVECNERGYPTGEPQFPSWALPKPKAKSQPEGKATVEKPSNGAAKAKAKEATVDHGTFAAWVDDQVAAVCRECGFEPQAIEDNCYAVATQAGYRKNRDVPAKAEAAVASYLQELADGAGNEQAVEA